VLRLLVPGGTLSCSASSGISLSSRTIIDPLIGTEVTAPGKVTIDGTTSFTGHIQSGCFSGTGAIAVAFAAVAR
jgi:hypothetical protein